MTALEAVAIWNVNEFCKGSFSSLLRLPSLKRLEMKFWNADPGFALAHRIAKDLAGRRLDQVETLVLYGWWPDKPEVFLKDLRKLLAPFPKLKSLRLVKDLRDLRGSLNEHSVRLGRLVRRNLPHLSELVLSGHENRFQNLGAYVRLVLRGLGSEWTAVPAALGRAEEYAMRFVVRGRDRAESSTHFFEDEFFRSN
jgi:hypothetical protein